jgi:beta-1,4-mannosyl-glycoprotein beta-1,4-N-acetylglucosaminyltransferase
MKKIYDCFLFFNELDLLDIRLNLLNDVVDKFVIVESTITFSGKEKGLFFNENRHMFEKFNDKIIHIVVDDTPENFNNISFIQNPSTQKEIFKNKVLKYLNESSGWNRNNPNEIQWGREIYQRESIINGLLDCSDNDLIIISDVDEIPNPLELIKIKDSNQSDVFEFKQNMFYYNINTLKERGWSGPKIAHWSIIKENSLNILRQNKLTNNVVEDGGWHLSFMGGENRIKDKLEAYAHQEYNNNVIKENIVRNIQSKNDLFFRGSLSEIDINIEFPKSLLDLITEKYQYLIK